jgi:hypothetical protein
MRLLVKNQTRHGHHGTKVYRLWSYIVKRCEAPSSSNYKYYGGRGIKVCDEWRTSPDSFIKWAMANGYSEGMTIDRINVDGNYEPPNCRFITHKENCAAGKRRLFSNNKTGHTGVYLSRHGTFEMYGQVNGKQKYLGVRRTLESAIIDREIILEQLIQSK